MSMTEKKWQPGDVALLPNGYIAVVDEQERLVYGVGEFLNARPRSLSARNAIPLVVIDPEDKAQTLALAEAYIAANPKVCSAPAMIADRLENALREFANPTPPIEEPTDPTARVTDKRDNTWRLLADGDWVCVDGPDSGEYLAWSGLTERGPLTIDVPIEADR